MPISESKDLARHLGKIGFFRSHQVRWVTETGSTNDDLKCDWLSETFKPVFLVADCQTSGRGQFQRRWLSDESQCLMFSFSHETTPGGFPPSIIAGIAVFKALEMLCGSAPPDLWLKWPNDLWFGTGKLAGILTEATSCGRQVRIVTGVGINISPLKRDNLMSAGITEFVENQGSLRLLKLFCQAYDEVAALPATAFCRLYTERSRQFWQKSFLVREPGIAAWVGRPVRLEVDGSLILADEKGLQKTLVSATLQPIL